MLFGDKNIFAIEFEISTFYGDSFIGDGYFLVYIDSCCYGKKAKNATVFGSIEWELQTYFLNHLEDSYMGLSDYSDVNICEVYYDRCYRVNNDFSLSNYKQIIQLIDSDVCPVKEWSVETAFDDGSFLLQLNEEKKIRLMGFKVYDNGKMKDIHSVAVTREYYQKILQGFIIEINKYKSSS